MVLPVPVVQARISVMELRWRLLHNVEPALPPWTHKPLVFGNCRRNSRGLWRACIRRGVGLGSLSFSPLVGDDEHPEPPHFLEIAVPYADLRVIGVISTV